MYFNRHNGVGGFTDSTTGMKGDLISPFIKGLSDEICGGEIKRDFILLPSGEKARP